MPSLDFKPLEPGEMINLAPLVQDKETGALGHAIFICFPSIVYVIWRTTRKIEEMDLDDVVFLP